MFYRESLSQFNIKNFSLWVVLAAQAGIINVGGFLACHRFVTHTTGFATFFATDVAKARYSDAIGMLAVPGFFMLGAMISGFFVDRRILKNLRPNYSLILFFMALIQWSIFVFGSLGNLGPFGNGLLESKDYVILIGLCLASGLQNAVITSASQSVIRTTHLTGFTTDLGIGLVRLIFSTHKESQQQELEASYMRLGIILAFVFGSMVGAFAFTEYHYYAFIIPGLISSALWFLSIQTSIRNAHP